MTAREIQVNHGDLEALDAFLSSGRAPEDSMMLSDLDGFLTGIAIGPELIMPSEWLPIVWGGEGPVFADEAEASTMLGAIMSRYNEILRQIEEDAFDPIFWTDPDGLIIAADWAEGFMQAVGLRVEAWGKLLKSNRGAQLLFPILALCGDENGESLLGLAPEDEDLVMAESPELVPAAVMEIAAYWRGKGEKQISIPLGDTDSPVPFSIRKPGRNDPCPCGSGKKFKKCCGRSG